jgi:hypothetical protein
MPKAAFKVLLRAMETHCRVDGQYQWGRVALELDQALQGCEGKPPNLVSFLSGSIVKCVTDWLQTLRFVFTAEILLLKFV